MCKTLAPAAGTNPSSVISAAAPILFNFPFEFYNNSKRAKFEQDFIRHFYMREIGAETVSLWRLYLEDFMMLKLPYYNKLWEAVETSFNFLDTDDAEESEDIGYNSSRTTEENGKSTVESTTDGTGKANTTSTANGTTDTTSSEKYRHSTTPQSTIQNLEDGTYMDEASITDSSAHTANTNTTTTQTSTENTATTNGNTETTKDQQEKENRSQQISRRKTGRQGYSPAKLMEEYLSAMRNITEAFYQDAEVLFMLIY